MNQDIQIPEELIEQGEIASKYAKENNIQDLKAHMEQIRNDINSDDRNVARGAQTRAAVMVRDLLQLVLYQEIEGMKNQLPGKNQELISMFDDGLMKNGNTATYDKSLDTGYETYQTDTYVPTTSVKPKFESPKNISMYDSSGALTGQAYQYLKRISIKEPEWLPYFMSGKLNQFLSIKRAEVRRGYNLFIYDRIMTLIATATPQKTITDNTSADMWDAMNQLAGLYKQMTLQNSSFNYKAGTQSVNWKDKQELIMLVGTNTGTRLELGVASRLYNNKFLLGERGLLNSERVYTPGSKIVVPNDNNQVISVNENQQYVPDNTIHIISKDAIKHKKQVDFVGQQEYIQNMTIELCLHVWGVMDIIDWESWLKYTCNNLNKLPTGISTTGEPIAEVNKTTAASRSRRGE